MKKYTIALAGGLVLLAGACQDNPVSPSRDRVVAGSAQSLQTLMTGFLASDRQASAAQSYYAMPGIMARDVARLDPNETRSITEVVETPPDPSDFVGGAQWTFYYIAIRAAHSILKDPSLTSLAAGPQNAAAGFIRTVEASDYMRVIETHDVNGAVIQGDDPTKVDPIRTKTAVLTYIGALLDSAEANLVASGGASLPFAVPGGYTVNGDYSNVSNLILYNRGLKGRIMVELGLASTTPDAAALTTAKAALDSALAGAPATPTQAYLNQGPYFEFNPAAPENFSNPLVDLKLLVQDNFVSSIMPGDARKANILPSVDTLTAKVYTARNREAITDPNNTANLTVPLPILRNGNLYLLRAQAEIGLGDLAGATRDINVIHTVEGGLPPYATFADAASAINALLYEYRYSFVLQGPQHLIALREYNMLNEAYVKQPGILSPENVTGVPGYPFADALTQRLPIPLNESNARNGNVTPVP